MLYEVITSLVTGSPVWAGIARLPVDVSIGGPAVNFFDGEVQRLLRLAGLANLVKSRIKSEVLFGPFGLFCLQLFDDSWDELYRFGPLFLRYGLGDHLFFHGRDEGWVVDVLVVVD